MLVGVTDHAVERYLQRVRGVLDARPEIAGRVRRAYEAGNVTPGERGAVHVRDLDRPTSSTSASTIARATSSSS